MHKVPKVVTKPDSSPRQECRPGLPRWFEATGATALLLLTSPLALFLAVAVAVSSGFPILFRQTRVGRDGKLFELLKFRTMCVGGDEGPTVTAAGDPRVTRLGRTLRRLKLDELPGLLHVAAGTMSLVGPRPEVPKFVDPESESWRQVLRARPGLTDPTTLRLYDEESLIAEADDDAEVFYRTKLLPYKLAAQRDYLATRTWASDLRVLAATTLAVLGHTNSRHRPVTLQDLEDS